MNNKLIISVSAVIIALIIIMAGNPFYIVSEGRQAIVTQFGDPVGDPVTAAGLHLKVPFIQKVTYFEKRILEWDGYPNQIPTKDKRYILVDTTARWRIINALKFYKSVTNEQGAQTILDGIIDAAVRDSVTAQNLIEIVRTTNNIIDDKEILEANIGFIDEGALDRVDFGREEIRSEIITNAKKDIKDRYGIELLDLRIKRVNYVDEVRRKAYERMIAERKRAAEQYRSEGRGVRADIEGQTEKELKSILSEAYKTSQVVKGEADAKSAKIYADAYNKDPEFFAFTKTLETYNETIDKGTSLILTTDSEYFKYLK
jgi:modulator of FtsH protease HflC